MKVQLRYEVYMTQGQGSHLVSKHLLLRTALVKAKKLQSQGSVAIKMLDGSWYDWRHK
jgi:hypothetical protein